MVIQGAVSAAAIVEGFDVIEDFGASLTAGSEVAAIYQFELEGAPEAFHGGVVVAVGCAAHGGDETRLAERLAVIGAGILDTAIGVEQQTGGRIAVQEGHGQSFQDEGGVDALTHGRADDLAAVEVQDSGQIEPSPVSMEVMSAAQSWLGAVAFGAWARRLGAMGWS